MLWHTTYDSGHGQKQTNSVSAFSRTCLVTNCCCDFQSETCSEAYIFEQQWTWCSLPVGTHCCVLNANEGHNLPCLAYVVSATQVDDAVDLRRGYAADIYTYRNSSEINLSTQPNRCCRKNVGSKTFHTTHVGECPHHQNGCKLRINNHEMQNTSSTLIKPHLVPNLLYNQKQSWPTWKLNEMIWYILTLQVNLEQKITMLAVQFYQFQILHKIKRCGIIQM